jgi:hypothetical protein
LDFVQERKIRHLRITEAVFLGVINGFISSPPGDHNTGIIREYANQIVNSAKSKAGGALSAGTILDISKRHLPDKLVQAIGQHRLERKYFDVLWTTGDG